jgi:hypothetical protein
LSLPNVGFGQASNVTIFFLQDPMWITLDDSFHSRTAAEHQTWCGYKSENTWMSEAKRIGVMNLGKIEYRNRRLSKIYFTQSDETGDWSAEDEYSFGEGQRIVAVKRMVVHLGEGLRNEQQLVIRNGMLVKVSDNTRNLNGKPTNEVLLDSDYPAIVRTVAAFPFWGLVRDNYSQILSKGATCVPE